MNYIGITIGPIIKTLGMAKRPRELWSASYLFSYLMKSIIENMPKEVVLLSPAKDESFALSRVGVYPDRLYLKNTESLSFEIIKDRISKTVKQLSETLRIDNNYLTNYLKIYAVEIVSESDSSAILKLNQHLDACELENKVVGKESQEQPVLKLIKMKSDSPLFNIALGTSKFPIETLSEIATEELSRIHANHYKKCLKEDENDFIKKLKVEFGDQFKTPHKYICIVHADGDNVGKLVTSLTDGEHVKLSADLMNFGRNACAKISEYGGLPIFAGGDDLLFIAPVVSRETKTNEQLSIFDLLDQINVVFKTSLFNGDAIIKYQTIAEVSLPSLSYGIAISYYKYPLYESLEKSRANLFDVAKKHNKGIKNSIAWSFQKNSGSTVTSVLSESNVQLFKAFKQLIIETKDEQLVSSVAHKIRNSVDLFSLFGNSNILEIRIQSYFKNYLEYKEETKDENESAKEKRLYLEAVRTLLIELFNLKIESKEVIDHCYAILRTAKFIKGLEDDHE